MFLILTCHTGVTVKTRFNVATFRKRAGKWQVQIRRSGSKPVSKTFHLKSDASKWARENEIAIDRGDNQLGDCSLEKMRLRDLLIRYVKEITPKKKSFIQETNRLGQLIRHEVSEIPLSKMTSGHFSQFRDSRLKGRGPQAVRHELNVLSHAIKTAMIEWDYPIQLNPLDNIKKPAIPKGRDRRLNKGELEKLEAGASLGQSEYLFSLISFAIETGMRKGEILNLKWDDIDFQGRVVLLEETKNGHARTVPLNSRAIKILKMRPKDQDIYPFNIRESRLRSAWIKLLKRVGISDLHFHDLRHEAISRLFEQGLSIPEVALISGHRDPRMLFKYTHLRARDVVKKLK